MLCQDGMLDHREDCLPRQDNLVRQAGEDPGDSGIKLLTAAATNNLYNMNIAVNTSVDHLDRHQQELKSRHQI